jgi:hypothetical protein
MRTILTRIVAAFITFALGIAAGVAWLRLHRHDSQPARINRSQPDKAQEESELPLTSILVARSLQTRAVQTKDLKRNSSDEIIWRWLRQEITRYQSTPDYKRVSLVLPLKDEHEYELTLHQVNEEEFKSANQFLLREGLPPLKPERRYARVGIHLDNLICPDWGGYIDLEEPKLVFFRGTGG